MTDYQRHPHAYTSAPKVPIRGDGSTVADPLPVPAARTVSWDAPSRHERGVAPGILAERLPDPYRLDSQGPAGPSVRCNVCAHRCTIRDGRSGICGVRQNRGGELVSLVYGEIVAAHCEPIEKKPLFHVRPGTDAYSISTKGCNFHCRFCQNWEIAQAPREGLHPRATSMTPAEVVREAVRSGARSIAYTYVEPTVFLEFALDTAALAHEAGLLNVFVTNGYQTPEAIRLMGPLIDAANVDLKGFNAAFYRRVVGAKLEHVLESLVEMRRLGIWVEVTTLVVPGGNDDPVELRAAAGWIAKELGVDTPWHISRYFPAYRMGDVLPTSVAALVGTAQAGLDAGLHHVYVGNARGLGGTDTRCGACGRTLIRRVGYDVVERDLVDGACPGCRTPLAGIGLGG